MIEEYVRRIVDHICPASATVTDRLIVELQVGLSDEYFAKSPDLP
jgi:hypothetical protein